VSPPGCNNVEVQKNVENYSLESEYLGTEPVELKLNSSNYVKGYLPDKHGLVIIVDSGATQTLISGECVKTIPYLSGLPQIDIEPIHFKIGNGEFLHATKAVNVEVLIQNNKLRLHAIIADNLTGPDILLGASSLTQLNSSLDFSTHTLTVRPKRIQFTPSYTTTIKPGQTRNIVIRGKVPKLLKNTDSHACQTAQKLCHNPSE
jgi:hypothetical protein